MHAGAVGVPVWRGGRAFSTRRDPGQEHAVLRVREADGTERVLVDPMALDPAGTTTLDAWSPPGRATGWPTSSPSGGDEESVLHVLDVATGEVVDGPIDRCRYSPVAWLPGGEELFYVRRLAAGPGARRTRSSSTAASGATGSAPRADDDVARRTARAATTSTPTSACTISRDGRWLVVSGSAGTARRDDVWIADLHRRRRRCTPSSPGRAWTPQTRRGWPATAGSSCTPTAAPRAGGSPSPTPPTPGRRALAGRGRRGAGRRARRRRTGCTRRADDAATACSCSAAAGTRSTSWRCTALDGAPRGTRPVPGLGSCAASPASTATPERDGGLGRLHRLRDPAVGAAGSTLRHGRDRAGSRPPSPAPSPSLTVVETHVRPRADGTPVHTVRAVRPDGTPRPARDPTRPLRLRRLQRLARPRPTPRRRWPGSRPAACGRWPTCAAAASTARSGTAPGMRERKQNVFDDFAAAGEHLVAAGLDDARPARGHGRLQRRPAGRRHADPAARPRPPPSSAARRCWTWSATSCSASAAPGTTSTAPPRTRRSSGWLLGYSPYHRGPRGHGVPGGAVHDFESDTRVDPLHARKLGAALQHATAATRRPARAAAPRDARRARRRGR